LAIDEHRITLGTAKRGIFGNDFHPFLGLEGFKGFEILEIDNLYVQCARIGIDREF
jgi:hypothetical protein